MKDLKMRRSIFRGNKTEGFGFGFDLALALGLFLWSSWAEAQVGGLYWQCVAPSSTNPQGSYCPVNSTYPLPVNVTTGGATGVAQGSATAAQLGTLIQGAASLAAPAYTTATTNPLSLGLSGDLRTSIQPTSAATSGITPGSSLGATSLVLKATPGNLYSAYALNRTTTAGFIVIYNATAAPAPGALTGALVLGCIPLPASGVGSLNNIPGPPDVYSVGVTMLITSASNCGTYTTGTITADIFGKAS